MAQAELIFTGDELLRGEVVNTNQSFLAEALLLLGIETTLALCVPDGRAEIASAIRDSLARRKAAPRPVGGRA
ncbi:MAG TPA: molybdopterin-binding protein, partial [Thermoleophilia bacterium]|nr:molybdopterin-binding protein [Thermoleophilia bacterium]